jgi:hypothetical protein
MKPADLSVTATPHGKLDDTTPQAACAVASPEAPSAAGARPAATAGPAEQSTKPAPQAHPRANWWQRFIERMEVRVSRLSTRNNFWHRVCSWIWLPLAFRSGIKFHKGSVGTFAAVLPFRRFNRNWYSAMAGGALLANSEVAGGMYVFRKCGADYTVVCKRLEYDFLRPCVGPAVYQIEPLEDIDQLLHDKAEFNITLEMNIVQMVSPKQQRQRRVGRCIGQFHVTPKTNHRQRKHRLRS